MVAREDGRRVQVVERADDLGQRLRARPCAQSCVGPRHVVRGGTVASCQEAARECSPPPVVDTRQLLEHGACTRISQRRARRARASLLLARARQGGRPARGRSHRCPTRSDRYPLQSSAMSTRSKSQSASSNARPATQSFASPGPRVIGDRLRFRGGALFSPCASSLPLILRGFRVDQNGEILDRLCANRPCLALSHVCERLADAFIDRMDQAFPTGGDGRLCKPRLAVDRIAAHSH